MHDAHYSRRYAHTRAPVTALTGTGWSWRAGARLGRCTLPQGRGIGQGAKGVVAHNWAAPRVTGSGPRPMWQSNGDGAEVPDGQDDAAIKGRGILIATCPGARDLLDLPGNGGGARDHADGNADGNGAGRRRTTADLDVLRSRKPTSWRMPAHVGGQRLCNSKRL